MSPLSNGSRWAGIAAAALATLGFHGTAYSQKAGAGGVASTTAPTARCSQSLGTVTIVEEPAANLAADLPPQFRALMEMAARQNGEAAGSVAATPLLNILASQSGCFQVVDRSEGFAALQRERELRGEKTAVRAADWILKTETVYSDSSGRGGGGVGGFGGNLGGAAGIRMRNLEAQVLLTLTDVSEGVQRAVASGTARRKDAQFLGGGLAGLGVAAIAGSGYNSDLGKVTAVAIVDGFNKLMAQMPSSMPAPADQSGQQQQTQAPKESGTQPQ